MSGMYIGFCCGFGGLAIYDYIAIPFFTLMGWGVDFHADPAERAGAFIAAAICLLANAIENHRAG